MESKAGTSYLPELHQIGHFQPASWHKEQILHPVKIQRESFHRGDLQHSEPSSVRIHYHQDKDLNGSTKLHCNLRSYVTVCVS